MKSIAAVLVCVAAALTFAAPAFARTFVVDAPNPDVECPNADFPSIQAAVAAAEPGDHVRVCPGSYRERVVVPKTISLFGAGPDPSVRVGDPRQEAVIDFRGGLTEGFVLDAPGIFVEGFTFRRKQIGIQTNVLFSGYVIRKNYFFGNTQGIDLPTAPGEQTVVEENTFFLNVFAISNLRAPRVDNVVIRVNDFRRNPNGIMLRGRQMNLEIVNNEFFESPSGVLLTRPLDSRIAHNMFARVDRAIRIQGGRRVNVDFNLVGSGRLDGIELLATAASKVSTNHVTARALGNGIVVAGGGPNVIEFNQVYANGGSGIVLRSASGTIVRANRSAQNVRDGIELDFESADNLLQNNHADGNLEHDCHDDSVGPGTGGTANIWLHNLGDTANRKAICMATGRPVETAEAMAAAERRAVTPAPAACVGVDPVADPDGVDVWWAEAMTWDEVPVVCDLPDVDPETS